MGDVLRVVLTVLLLAGAVAGVIGWFYLKQRWHRRVVRGMTDHAADRGWTYQERPDWSNAVLTLPATVPRLEVGLAGLGSKLVGAMGIRDLQLGNHEFDDAFLVRADDEAFAADVLGEQTIDWLLAEPTAGFATFRFTGRDLVVFATGPIDPARVDLFVNYACDIADRVPDSVWTR